METTEGFQAAYIFTTQKMRCNQGKGGKGKGEGKEGEKEKLKLCLRNFVNGM